jgi:hypothetical protein
MSDLPSLNATRFWRAGMSTVLHFKLLIAFYEQRAGAHHPKRPHFTQRVREYAEVEAVAQEVQQSCGEALVLAVLADVAQERGCAQVVETAVTRSSECLCMGLCRG